MCDMAVLTNAEGGGALLQLAVDSVGIGRHVVADAFLTPSTVSKVASLARLL